MYRSSGMKNEELIEQVSSKLNSMILEINSVRERLDDRRQPHPVAPSLDNLRSCVQIAHELTSCASRSMRDGGIRKWIKSTNCARDDEAVSSHPFLIHLQMGTSDSVVLQTERRSSTVSQSMSNILHFYERGEFNFNAQNYQAACPLLDRAYSKLETTYSELEDRGLHFKDWEDLFNLLVLCQCNLQKFDKALNTLNSLIQKIGSELVAESVVNAISKATEVLISNFCRVERLDDAASLATKVIDLKISDSLGTLDTQRILAEIHLRQDKIEEAEGRCLEIIAARDSNERAQIDDETDLLLFLIYSQTGNTGEALCRKELLSETYKSK
jgi:hypothetical protein